MIKFSRRKKGAPESDAVPQEPKSSVQQYCDEASAWEQDRIAGAKKSEKRAWIVAGAALVLALGAVGAVAGLAPLKAVEPFVIRVDNSTGIVDVVSALDETKSSYEEAVSKYFLGKYVTVRERWLYQIHEEDYQTIGLFSATDVQKKYGDYMDPRKNPASPLNVYGEAAEVHIDIKNISFINDEVAMVRYTKTVERAGERAYPTHWVATIPFTYYPAPERERDRLVNPLGFQVTSYRNDPETVSEGT